MKVIIAYASAGAGHTKAAKALHHYFKEKSPQSEIIIVDVLEKASSLFRLIYIQGYAFLVRHAPLFWALAFYLTRAKILYPFTRAFIFFLSRVNARNFLCLLTREDPDLIISTHFFTSELTAYLKNKGKIHSKLITVITDFGVHPFWLCKGTDLYVAASGLTKEILINEGIEGPKIMVLGIPVEEKFLRQYNREELCRKLNISCQKFTALIITGSFGIGPIEEIVESLYSDVQLLVVCATNRKLFFRLSQKNYPGVFLFKFVDNIEELMTASDIIITKPGGLSIAEALSMELPPLFIAAIPGQETENMNILKNYGIGVKIRNIRHLKNTVLDYKDHPVKLNLIKENIRKIKKTSTAGEIYNAVR